MDQNTKSNEVLNLDEMLGETKIVVRIAGKEYPIRTVKSLTPQEFGKVMAYGAKFASLTEEEFERQDGQVVMKAIDDLLEIIAPSLPRYKPTMREFFSRGYKRRFAVSLHEATAIMQFWKDHNRPKNAVGAVGPKPKRKRSR